MKVKVYRNQHKKCWSVIGPDGKVFRRMPRVVISDADLIVRPGGRKQVLETGRKNVHAFAVGHMVESNFDASTLVPIAYNPRLNETFIRCDNGEAVYCAEIVLLDDDGKAYAKLPGATPKLKTINFLLNHRKAILSPKDWSRLLDVTIFDPDGWRRDEKDFDSPIGLEEFLERFTWSTVKF